MKRNGTEILVWNMEDARMEWNGRYFNRFARFWPKGYQLGSLGKSHQNGDYLKQAMRKIVFPQESNLQPLDYRSTALPLELEKTPRNGRWKISEWKISRMAWKTIFHTSMPIPY